VRANSGRYADDFSLVDAAGNLFQGDGGRRADWYGFGAPVRAPASGTVVAAVGSVAHNELAHGGVEFAALPDDPAAAIFGNHVIIDHGGDEHSVLGHLQHESVEVAPGDRVEGRQVIARVGLSGNTDFVHLHYQLQGGPDPRLAEGLPTRFAELGPLEAGTIVESS
jgi:murein DD-endopeptidase MepM/ murein hydrolase activator NlpD